MIALGRYGAILVATAAIVAGVMAACSDGDEPPGPGTEPSSRPGAGGPPSGATPSSGTIVPAGSPAPGRTLADGAPDATTDAPSGTPVPPSAAEATLVAGVGEEIAGGDPAGERALVAPLPTPPPGAAQSADPTSVAPAQAPDATYQLLVDLDASTPGIQTQRTTAVGDRVRVAIVLANVPPDAGGVAAFQFHLRYDKTVVIAPSYTGGPATERNPRLTIGEGSWTCLPAPEGDLDDPGGIEGDGDPATGEAFLSCYALDAALQGTLVLGVVELVAVASGATALQPAMVAAGNPAAIAIGRCVGDPGDGVEIPCPASTLTVQ